MPGAYFYLASLSLAAEEFSLDEPASRHIIQVLRMELGDELVLTDGKGLRATASILDSHKKHCRVRIAEKHRQPPDAPRISIALSLLKNSTRFEWFLEKATELGIAEIVPLRCARTEKQQFRVERMHAIVESALIQSQQSWMPVIEDPLDFEDYAVKAGAAQKLIAHCGEGEKRPLREMNSASPDSRLLLIGPEGDFTTAEIALALRSGFDPVSLGANRLRAETAALTAAVLLKLG